MTQDKTDPRNPSFPLFLTLAECSMSTSLNDYLVKLVYRGGSTIIFNQKVGHGPEDLHLLHYVTVVELVQHRRELFYLFRIY